MRILTVFLLIILMAFPAYCASSDESGNELYAMARKSRTRKAVRKIERERGREVLSLDVMPVIWPIEGYVTSHFGMRRSPFTGKMRMHNGIDIGAPTGTPIRASADGLVIFAGRDGNYGNSVELYHARGMTTRFAHMSKIIAKEGQKVKRGDIIGEVGSTGMSTGPHLHYEVLLHGTPSNPLRHVIFEDKSGKMAEGKKGRIPLGGD